MTRLRSRTALLVAVVSALALAACSASAEDPPGVVGVAAYRAVLDRFVPETDPEPDPIPIVYVAMIGDAELSLDEQVAVIDAFALTHEIRFVDEIEAAIDLEQPGSPPKDDATILAIGRIPPEPPHLVRVEEYVDEGRTDASLVTVTEAGGAWSVGSVEPVDAEVVVEDE